MSDYYRLRADGTASTVQVQVLPEWTAAARALRDVGAPTIPAEPLRHEADVAELPDYVNTIQRLHLFSERARAALDAVASADPTFGWHPATVRRSDGLEQQMWLMHFTEAADIIDAERSRFVGGIPVGVVLDEARAAGAAVFLPYPGASWIVVDGAAADALERSESRGIELQPIATNAGNRTAAIRRPRSRVLPFRPGPAAASAAAPAPAGLIKALHRGTSFGSDVTGETGAVTLHRAPVPSVLPVVSAASLEGHPSEVFDVPVLDLVAACDEVDPHGLLVWVPDEGCFGTWDDDHGQLLLFPGVSWADIAAAPATYLDGTWDPPHGSQYLDPSGRYPRHAIDEQRDRAAGMADRARLLIDLERARREHEQAQKELPEPPPF